MDMASIRTLTSLLKELEEGLVLCVRCGLCQSVCPLYAETGREPDVARGKLALLDGLARELLKDAQGVRTRLERCLLCGSCGAQCPSGVRVMELFLKARAILTGYLGLSPAKKLLFRGVLAHPALFDGLISLGSRFQNVWSRPVDEMLGTSCARIVSPLGDRHFHRLARKPFHDEAPFLRDRPGSSGITASLFVGCLLDKFYPQAPLAALKVLDHHGVGVIVPSSQACCGMPALSAGEIGSFHKLVRHTLERFRVREFDVLLTGCATCASTLKKMWPLMTSGMKDREREEIAELSEKTMDISQFLVDRGFVQAAPPVGSTGNPRITYHDPCHLKKSLGVWKQPRILLQAAGRAVLAEMEEADWCCGMGGGFGLGHYETSRAIGDRKLDHIRKTRASVVATSCPACMMQIEDQLSRRRVPIRVKHVIEVYAEGLTGR